MTVRFDPVTYELVAREAERSGVAVAQFVREASLIRALMRAYVEEGKVPLDRTYGRLYAELSEECARLSTAVLQDQADDDG